MMLYHLSCLLYVLKALSVLIRKQAMNLSLKGLKMGSLGLEITHLFFAGDNLLFMEATDVDTDQIKEVLHQYELASGQQINFQVFYHV